MTILRVLITLIAIMAILLIILPKTQKSEKMERKVFKILSYICASLIIALIVTIIAFKDVLLFDGNNAELLAKKIEKKDELVSLSLSPNDFNNYTISTLKDMIAKHQVNNLRFVNISKQDLSKISKLMAKDKPYINLSFHRLPRNDFKHIISSIELPNTLRYFSCNSCNLVNSDFEEILIKLSKLIDINTIDLENNLITGELSDIAISKINGLSNLRVVNLRNNEINSQDIDDLAHVIIRNNSVDTIDLWGNKLDDVGAAKLVVALRENNNLKILNLAYNKIQSPGAQDFAKLLKTHPSLVNIDLSRNMIGNSGAVALLEAAQNNRNITDLEMNNEKIDQIIVDDLNALLRDRKLIVD